MSPSDNAAAIGQRYTDGVRRHGHQPLLTYYDDLTGERTELSYATFDNWASKAANLLVEELGAQIGTRIRLVLIDHWTAAVVAAAAWKAGATVVLGSGPADVLVVHEDVAQGWDDDARLLVIGDGMGGRVSGAVDGIAFGDEVLAFADDYDDPGVGLDAPALDVDGRTWSQAELLSAGEVLLGAGDRVLTTLSFDGVAGVVATLIAPLAAGASALWCPHLDSAGIRRRADQERATHLATYDGFTPLQPGPQPGG